MAQWLGRKAVKWGIGVLGIFLLGTLGWKLYRSTYPLESGELMARVELRFHGVRETELGTLHAYEANGCARTAPENCTCVLLIHGLGDNALTWKNLLEHPLNDWVMATRWIAVDLPGSGHSASPAKLADYRVKAQAEELVQGLRSISQCAQWTVIGNSLGGWIAAWMGLKWPTNGKTGINKLVLLDSVGLKSQDTKSTETTFAEPTVQGLKDFQQRLYFKPRPIPEFVWPKIVEHFKRGNTQQVMAAQTADDYLDTYLASVQPKTMVFWGAADRVTPLQTGREMARMIPGALYREAPQCGHVPQKECPLALVTALRELFRYGPM